MDFAKKQKKTKLSLTERNFSHKNKAEKLIKTG